MSFGADVERWTAETLARMDLATRKISLDVFANVIRLSPVDTGRFRGNWQTSVGAPIVGDLLLTDPSGGAVQAKAVGVIEGVHAGDVIFMVNNLPYAQRLEEGYSGQAPSGMVMLTVQRFQPIADRVVRQIAAAN